MKALLSCLMLYCANDAFLSMKNSIAVMILRHCCSLFDAKVKYYGKIPTIFITLKNTMTRLLHYPSLKILISSLFNSNYHTVAEILPLSTYFQYFSLYFMKDGLYLHIDWVLISNDSSRENSFLFSL